MTHFNHVARLVGANVQRRIDAIQIGQKMQDLPEELWHESFRFYLKEDPNRQGGPNLRIVRLDPDKPSLTVTGYIFNKFVHPFQNRFITVREAARLQAIPDKLRLVGSLTSSQLQVGNAVPPPLGQAVFQSVLDALRIDRDPLIALSLFTGAGGLDIGARMTGKIEVPVATDNWPDACASIQGFHPETRVLCRDVQTIVDPVQFWSETSSKNAPPDLIFGGPPCQSFSQAGKQRGTVDIRGSLIFEFARFVEALRPRAFVFENVSNFTSIEQGAIAESLMKRFEDLGYRLNLGVLLAADFGVPQFRRRIFILGSQEKTISMPEPSHGPAAQLSLFALKPFRTVGQVFEGLGQARFSNEGLDELKTDDATDVAA